MTELHSVEETVGWALLGPAEALSARVSTLLADDSCTMFAKNSAAGSHTKQVDYTLPDAQLHCCQLPENM